MRAVWEIRSLLYRGTWQSNAIYMRVKIAKLKLLSTSLAMRLPAARGAGGITEDERLLVSDGSWWAQRNRAKNRSRAVGKLPLQVAQKPTEVRCHSAVAMIGRMSRGDYLKSFDEPGRLSFVPGNFMLLHYHGGNAAALFLTPKDQCATHETCFLAFMTCLDGTGVRIHHWDDTN